MEGQIFNQQSLARFDGKDGRPAYVAYSGKVYEVTESVLWKDGEHEGEHVAGVDLTSDMDFAPHPPEDLDSFPVVGSYVSGSSL
jgi:predicted heme/steroid binding protein